MTHHILVATELTPDSMALLEQEPDVRVTTIAPNLPLLREHISEADALISRDDLPLESDLLAKATRLRLIARVSPTVTGVDIEDATQRGIIVMSTPGVSVTAAGEHTMTLMLALSRRLTVAHNSLRDGWWLLDRKRQSGTQLMGKTVGIIGLGRVGRVVAHRCLAFGMTVLAADPYISEEQVPDDRIQLVSLREVLERSDFVSLHTPATRETRRMINAETIAQMKPGARLINAAHGSLVDEAALATAIKEGHLAGAALDVFNEEPPYNSPLVGMEHVIHTPHIGDNTIEATQDLSLRVAQQVLDALNDRDYRNVINMPLLPGVSFEAVRPAIRLAERIGALQHTLARSPVQRVAIEAQGEDFAGLIKPLTVGMLKGLLTPILGEKVSYVNAPVLAREFGWHVTQVKGLVPSEYSEVLTCQVTLENGDSISISGTLLDHQKPRILQINQYRMNFEPYGYMLLMGSYDRPGVIGRVGTLLADHQVNIASWHTGRAEPGGQTLTVLTLDEALPEDVFNTLIEMDFVRHLHQMAIL